MWKVLGLLSIPPMLIPAGICLCGHDAHGQDYSPISGYVASQTESHSPPHPDEHEPCCPASEESKVPLNKPDHVVKPVPPTLSMSLSLEPYTAWDSVVHPLHFYRQAREGPPVYLLLLTLLI